MNITHQQTVDAMRSVLSPGDDIMIHASLSRLGHFEAGIDATISAICDAVGPTGTVIMMTDTRSFARTRQFSLDQRSETGLLTERFRVMPGVRRSCVPMGSFCALGPRAEAYTDGYDSHLDDTATLTRLLDNDGKIMLMGIGYQKCTLYHLAEERHAVPYNIHKEFRGVLLEHGKEPRPIAQRYFVRKDMSVRKDPTVAGRMLEESGKVRIVPLGSEFLRVFRARDFDACCMRALEIDPNAFLARSGARA